MNFSFLACVRLGRLLIDLIVLAVDVNKQTDSNPATNVLSFFHHRFKMKTTSLDCLGTTTTTVIVVVVGLAVMTTTAAGAAGIFTTIIKKSRKITSTTIPTRSLSEAEQWVHESIQSNMPPAMKMGITIDYISPGASWSPWVSNNNHTSELPLRLALIMPLKENTNIHGTAFAGSLYSLAALSAWYLVVHYLRGCQQQQQQQRQQNQDTIDRYVVVLKSAEIQYRVPVTWPNIVAETTLPHAVDLKTFWQSLVQGGKTILCVKGTILPEHHHDSTPATEYTAVLHVRDRSMTR